MTRMSGPLFPRRNISPRALSALLSILFCCTLTQGEDINQGTEAEKLFRELETLRRRAFPTQVPRRKKRVSPNERQKQRHAICTGAYASS